jgi:hypothetical protein
MAASEDILNLKKNALIEMKHLVSSVRKFRTIIWSSHGVPALPSK